jgi:hypothetical protein
MLKKPKAISPLFSVSNKSGIDTLPEFYKTFANKD